MLSYTNLLLAADDTTEKNLNTFTNITAINKTLFYLSSANTGSNM